MNHNLLSNSLLAGLILIIVWMVVSMLTKNMIMRNPQNKQFLQLFLSGAILNMVLCQLNNYR